MIIFESRPDSMPQISALALASGNGLLLKGGKEAANSNEAIHKVIGDAIEKGSGGKITRDIIALVTSRGQVADMLKLDDVVDLVSTSLIPILARYFFLIVPSYLTCVLFIQTYCTVPLRKVPPLSQNRDLTSATPTMAASAAVGVQ